MFSEVSPNSIPKSSEKLHFLIQSKGSYMFTIHRPHIYNVCQVPGPAHSILYSIYTHVTCLFYNLSNNFYEIVNYFYKNWVSSDHTTLYVLLLLKIFSLGIGILIRVIISSVITKRMCHLIIALY